MFSRTSEATPVDKRTPARKSSLFFYWQVTGPSGCRGAVGSGRRWLVVSLVVVSREWSRRRQTRARKELVPLAVLLLVELLARRAGCVVPCPSPPSLYVCRVAVVRLVWS